MSSIDEYVGPPGPRLKKKLSVLARACDDPSVLGRSSLAGVESFAGVKRRGAGRLLPARLGEYELFDHIGRGGMADIYRARKSGDFGVVREVVVKEILPELAQSERLAELLAAAARTASKLEHTNVVRIEDLQRDDRTLFIAMEYVDGLDLRELLRQCSRRGAWIPPELSVRIVIELLRALDYAHRFELQDADGNVRVGVIHRDVSPSNVLLSFEGEVKLCDFGIAKSYDGEIGEHATTIDGMVEGKAGYMSPEQARGEALDARADVFAAGIILWELLSARKFYKAQAGETLFDVARRAPSRPLPEKGLPAEHVVRALLAKALSDRREDRFGSAAEMQRELERYAARASLVASPLKLRRFLQDNVAPVVLEARRRRELAARAIARGPIAEIEPVTIDTTPPPAIVRKTSPAWSAVVIVALALILAGAILLSR
ncbi:MAG: serine/threonine protein kinase [Polyangiaceae bacterium]|nr:serine/threonine protein kinase [Polyangiaceae bacterium]